MSGIPIGTRKNPNSPTSSVICPKLNIKKLIKNGTITEITLINLTYISLTEFTAPIPYFSVRRLSETEIAIKGKVENTSIAGNKTTRYEIIYVHQGFSDCEYPAE